MALHKPPSEVKMGFVDGMFKKELLNRLIGSVFVLVGIVGGILLGGWPWAFIASAIALGSLWELYKILSTKYRLSIAWGMTGAIVLLLSVSFGLSYSVTLSVIAMVAFLVLFTEVVRRQNTGRSYALWNLGGTLCGLIYVVLPWSFLIVIRSQTWGYVFLLTIFFCTWSCDVGAYLVGTRFGRTPFCRKVSPKKTWEGFWAGVCASILCGAALALPFEFPPMPLVLLGAICGIAGQFGDLAESVLKREANIKESGKVIPGHGGFLDRFDSIFVNATIAFFVFEVIG